LPELPGGGATLFLAGEDHGYCVENQKQARRHPPECRRKRSVIQKQVTHLAILDSSFAARQN